MAAAARSDCLSDHSFGYFNHIATFAESIDSFEFENISNQNHKISLERSIQSLIFQASRYKASLTSSKTRRARLMFPPNRHKIHPASNSNRPTSFLDTRQASQMSDKLQRGEFIHLGWNVHSRVKRTCPTIARLQEAPMDDAITYLRQFTRRNTATGHCILRGAGRDYSMRPFDSVGTCETEEEGEEGRASWGSAGDVLLRVINCAIRDWVSGMMDPSVRRFYL